MSMTELSDVLTKDKLIAGLQSLGITGSQILEVHTKISAFHYVVGGAKTIVDALMELCQNGGTILMPAQVADNSEPSDWQYPPISPLSTRAYCHPPPGDYKGPHTTHAL